MQQYKVGDKVRFKSSLKVGEIYSDISFLPMMNDERNRGEIFTMSGCNSRDNRCYAGGWFLSLEMLEPVEVGTPS